MEKVQECIRSGKWDEKDIELKIAEELLTTTNAGDLVLKGGRIVTTTPKFRIRK